MPQKSQFTAEWGDMKQNRHISQAKERLSGLHRPDDFYWEDLKLILVQKAVESGGSMYVC